MKASIYVLISRACLIDGHRNTPGFLKSLFITKIFIHEWRSESTCINAGSKPLEVSPWKSSIFDARALICQCSASGSTRFSFCEGRWPLLLWDMARCFYFSSLPCDKVVYAAFTNIFLPPRLLFLRFISGFIPILAFVCHLYLFRQWSSETLYLVLVIL